MTATRAAPRRILIIEAHPRSVAVGLRPVCMTIFDMVEGVSRARRRAWIDEMNGLGRLGL